MKILAAIAVLLLAGMTPAFAQGWHDRQGNPIAETSATKSVEGFAGMLVVTPDADWQEKWNTPAEDIPHFTEASEVRLGGKLQVLIFFSNPLLDADRLADVTCDLEVIRPDGSKGVDQQDIECYQGPIPNDPANLYMAKPSLQFIAEAGDLPGEWTMRVTLRDNHRGVGMILEKKVALVVGGNAPKPPAGDPSGARETS
ncbi:MAG: hypothetical protein ACREO7_03185 [Pseudoxanthomonas sp.]